MSTNYYVNSGGTDTYAITGRLATQYLQNNGTHAWKTAPSGTAGNAITFTQAMTLDASGNLGIGTTSPSSKLDIVGANGTEQFRIGNTTGGTDFGITVTENSNAIIKSAEGATARGIQFQVGGIDTVIMNSAGAVLFGKTSDDVTNAGSYFEPSNIGYGRLNFVKGNTGTSYPVAFYYAGTQIGNISNSTTATGYNTASDYRLKDNQAPLTGSGAFIDSLQPKTWTWTADGSTGVGFIAHEAQAVSPNSVVGEKDAVDENGNPQYQAMEYGSAEFIANIVAELQDLRKRVAVLESK
jgi:hypothetical protein